MRRVNLAETGFVKVEILQASNTKVLTINDTRVSLEICGWVAQKRNRTRSRKIRGMI